MAVHEATNDRSSDEAERLREMAELRGSGDLLQAVLEAAEGIIFAKDLDGRYVLANPAFSRLFNLPLEEIIGKRDEELFPKEEAARLRAGDAMVVETERPLSSADRLTIGGKERVFVSTKVPLRNKSGKVIGLSGFATEITDEIRVRDQLAHLNQTLHAIEADEARRESEELYCDITERMAAEKALKDSYEKLERTLKGIVEALGAAIELRDPYTAGHQRRVAELAVAIAEEMGLPTEKVEATRYAALVHDIGKLAVPAEILAKSAALTDTEFALIKFHPQQAYNILKEIDFPWPLAEIVLQHHERLDGSGYPNGLKGDEILLEARIIAVADVVEAMSSHRPYRPALGIEAACDEIKAKRGKLYDPDVVDACVSLFEKGFSFA